METASPPPPSALRDSVAANIRVVLARKGLTARAVSLRLGHHEQYLAHRFAGKTRICLEDIEEIAADLDVDPLSLLPGKQADA